MGVVTMCLLPALHKLQELANWKGFIAFYALRLCLAPLLESMILVDRLQFLAELGEQTNEPCPVGSGGASVMPAKETGRDCALLPIFDPSVSPRNFVLVARKAQLG